MARHIMERGSKGPLKAIILVGGEGTRLRPLTYSTVKAMVPVLNRPFIEYVLRHLSSHDINDVVLALGYKPDSITDYFRNVTGLDTSLTYSVEDIPLGTAGPVRNAEQYMDDTFFVMNGDIFTDLDLTDMLAFHRSKGATVTIALTPVDDPTRFGVVETDSQHRVIRFLEKPARENITTNLINAGTYILDAQVLERIPQGEHSMFEHDIFPGLLADGEPVFGYPTDAYWIDMGTREKYLQLNRDLLYGKSSQVTFGAETIRIDNTTSIHPRAVLTGPILVDRDCSIGEAACLDGPLVVGPGCSIDDGATVENSVLWHNVTIGKGAVVKNSIVAGDNHIQNNVHIEGATINNMAPADGQA